MRCPTLSELPAPQPGKTGWPWTEESSQLPGAMADGRDWPRITIVTPSYGQGRFIEETIRSVLLQGYPNLEYMIFDGGSADETVEIIKKYEPWLAYWASEPDRGQSHAINKGMAKATGKILAYINSDDVYMEGAFAGIAEVTNPARPQLVFGDLGLIQETDWASLNILRKTGIGRKEMLFGGTPLPQPSSFWTKTLWEKVGAFDEGLHFAMDYDIMLRMLASGVEPVYIPQALSVERRHGLQKSSQKESLYEEKARVRFAVADSLGMSKRWYLARTLLFRRLQRPFRLHRWREYTLQEKMMVSLMRAED